MHVPTEPESRHIYLMCAYQGPTTFISCDTLCPDDGIPFGEYSSINEIRFLFAHILATTSIYLKDHKHYKSAKKLQFCFSKSEGSIKVFSNSIRVSIEQVLTLRLNASRDIELTLNCRLIPEHTYCVLVRANDHLELSAQLYEEGEHAIKSVKPVSIKTSKYVAIMNENRKLYQALLKGLPNHKHIDLKARALLGQYTPTELDELILISEDVKRELTGRTSPKVKSTLKKIEIIISLIQSLKVTDT